MRNLKKYAMILLGVVGITVGLNSCTKTQTCKCELEDDMGEITITVENKECEDITGEVEFYGSDYDIEECK